MGITKFVPARLNRVGLLFTAEQLFFTPQMEEDVTEARDFLEEILTQRKNTEVHLEQVNVQPKVGTCTYYVSFPGFYVSARIVVVDDNRTTFLWPALPDPGK